MKSWKLTLEEGPITVSRTIHSTNTKEITNAVEGAAKELERRKKIPKWQDYDVIAIKFQKDGPGPWYTYMRIRGYWPGAAGSPEWASFAPEWASKEDDFVDEAFMDGRVRTLVRNADNWDGS